MRQAQHRVKFDINVLTDVAANREPFASESGAAIDPVIEGKIEGFVAAHAVTTLFYLVHKKRGPSEALAAIDFVLAYFKVVHIDTELLHAARGLAGADFEDNVVICSALRANCEIIVSRDSSGFHGAEIPSLLPADFRAWLATVAFD